MKAIQPIGGKRCLLCRKVWAPNKITESRTKTGIKVWVCKQCEKAASRI